MTTNRPIKKLGEIAKTQSGGTPKREVKEFWGGKIPWLKSGELDGNLNINTCSEYITEKAVENSSAKLFKKGTLVMAMYGATAGKLGILGMDATTNQAVCSIQNNKGLFDNMYVYYFLLLNREKIIQDSFGGAQPNISKGYIDNISIPLPPLPTQQLIVAKLDETFAQIDEAIATTQANIAQTDELTKSVLDKRFNEGDMKFVDLDYVCSLITDGTHATPKYIENGIPFLSVKNITHGIIDFSDTRFVSKEEHQQLTKRCNPEFGDILYTKVGTTGIAKIIDVKRDFSIFVSLALLKVKKDIISNEYLEKILNSPLIYQQSQEKTRGVANRNLVIKDIKSIQIPLPPLAKQQEIVSYLDDIFAQSLQLKEQYQKKLVELKELKASVLQSAFDPKEKEQTRQ